MTVRNQRLTAAGNYLEYFVLFALSTPWSAEGAVKITGCKQDSESICTTASKVHLWAPTPAILHRLHSAGKYLEQEKSPKFYGYMSNAKGQFNNSLINSKRKNMLKRNSFKLYPRLIFQSLKKVKYFNILFLSNGPKQNFYLHEI